ncbi:MAG TPA: acyl-CoA dehydrogenase C-terminal domain-containing protein, partial [Sphingomonas sp.]|nr:acyl-CoA dehydrogenase C-terminal domain-containing protein [Sphingomonas sp.]
AQTQLDAGEGNKAFLEAKLVTARFYFDRIAPRAFGLRKELEGGADALMALPPEAFARAA